MKPDDLIARALQDDLENDIAQYGSLPDHNFSFRFRRKMKKLLAGEKSGVCSRVPRLPLKKSMKLALIVLVTAIITGAVFAVHLTRSFRGTVYSDNTHLFVVDPSGSPKRIQMAYRLSVVPEGYELYEVNDFDTVVYVVYKNSYDDILIFEQNIKESFSSHINTEKGVLEETSVNGCDAVCIQFEYEDEDHEHYTSSLVMWNNEKYILSLDGIMPKEEIVDLAIRNEICGYEEVPLPEVSYETE